MPRKKKPLKRNVLTIAESASLPKTVSKETVSLKRSKQKKSLAYHDDSTLQPPDKIFPSVPPKIPQKETVSHGKSKQNKLSALESKPMGLTIDASSSLHKNALQKKVGLLRRSVQQKPSRGYHDDSTLHPEKISPSLPPKIPQKKIVSPRKSKRNKLSAHESKPTDLPVDTSSSLPKSVSQKKVGRLKRSNQKKPSPACLDDLVELAQQEIPLSSPPKISQKEIASPRRSKRNKLSLPSHEANLYDNCSESISYPECDDLSEKQLLEQFSLLQSLQKREKELKTIVLFEKLRKEEPILTDTILVSKHIAELEKIKQERIKDFKLREIISSNNQLTEILEIVTKPCHNKKKSKCQEVYEYTDEERKLILDEILKKKQINKEMSLQQQEILEIEEQCIKLKTILNMSVLSNPENTSRRKTILDSSFEDELKQLAAENERINSRIQLQCRIMQFLIQHIESENNLKDDIKVLFMSCEKILNWDYDDLDEMEELCKSVYLTQI